MRTGEAVPPDLGGADLPTLPFPRYLRHGSSVSFAFPFLDPGGGAVDWV